MKKYIELEITINEFDKTDVIRTSNPVGDNTLPWVDVTATNVTDVIFS